MHVVEEVGKILASITTENGVDFIMSPELELTDNYGDDNDRVSNGCVITWSRTPLKPSLGMGRRIAGAGIAVFTEDEETVVVGALGEFDLRWRFYAANMDVIEEFELLYSLQQHTSRMTEIMVATTNIMDFKYTIEWEPLEELVFTHDEQFGMYLESTASIRGVFIAKRPRNANDTTIRSINDDVDLNVLTNITVLPDVHDYEEYLRST